MTIDVVLTGGSLAVNASGVRIRSSLVVDGCRFRDHAAL